MWWFGVNSDHLKEAFLRALRLLTLYLELLHIVLDVKLIFDRLRFSRRSQDDRGIAKSFVLSPLRSTSL